MSWDVLFTCVLIVLARMTDVSLGTLRTAFVVQGRRNTALIIGFIELLIWVVVVSKVIQNLNNVWYAISFASGFALGTWLGMTIEQRLAFGNQVVRIFTRAGVELAKTLRKEGYWVTMFNGEGRDGPVQLLFIELPRRHSARVSERARELDPKCYCLVDDVRLAESIRPSFLPLTGWRAVPKKK